MFAIVNSVFKRLYNNNNNYYSTLWAIVTDAQNAHYFNFLSWISGLPENSSADRTAFYSKQTVYSDVFSSLVGSKSLLIRSLSLLSTSHYCRFFHEYPISDLLRVFIPTQCFVKKPRTAADLVVFVVVVVTRTLLFCLNNS